MTRQEIRDQIKANLKQIEDLIDENARLKIEGHKLCDNQQWYTEGVETFIVSKRPKRTVEVMIGRIHWNELFQDDTLPKGEGVIVKRSEIVRYDGVWQV